MIKTRKFDALLMPGSVLLSALLLFWSDHETRSFADLMAPGNLAALAFYCIPTFLICLLLYHLLENKRHTLLKSLLIGIPAGFASVILLILAMR